MSNRKFINLLIFFLSRYHISSFCHPPNVISNISNRLCRNSIFKLVKLNILNELQKYASFMISCTASKCNIWIYDYILCHLLYKITKHLSNLLRPILTLFLCVVEKNHCSRNGACHWVQPWAIEKWQRQICENSNRKYSTACSF